MKKLLIGCLLCLLGTGWNGYAAELQKQNKRILYVGYSPEKERPAYNARIAGYASEKRFVEDVQMRMTAFRELLERYFTVVETIDAREYQQELSKKYDVTIFDALLAPIVPRKDMLDEHGKFLRTAPEKYLTADFDCPAVFIAHTGGILQQGLDLKIDWCCLCLGAYALGVRDEHEVFHTPFPVVPTYEQRTTPYTVYHYLNGYALPDRIPMWKVQNSSYRDGKNERIGLVSFGEGFDDSPDAEVISGGESLKAVNTVAIGRHGNFLLWGFGASPGDLTPEAQTVFANCVAYISRFKGQAPVMKKSRTVMTVRTFVDDLLWVVSPEGYQQYVHKKQLINADCLRQRETVKQRLQEKGEPVDVQVLEEKYALSEILSEEAFYKTFLGEELGEVAVHDRKKCRKYILECKPYFYGAGTFNQFVIDEDARYLKISNRDKRLLDKCISLWEKGKEIELAKRVLLKYTHQQFDSSREWRSWYEKNKENLFFTEAGGYKFIENVRNRKDTGVVTENTDSPVVQVAGSLLEKEGKRFIRIAFSMKDGFHIYAEGNTNTPFVATSVDFECPEGIKTVGGLVKPVGTMLEGTDEVMVYEKEAEFLQEISGVGRGLIKCRLKYQCCNDQICMPPVEEKLTIE